MCVCGAHLWAAFLPPGGANVKPGIPWVYSPQRTRRTQRSCCPQIESVAVASHPLQPSAPIYTDFLQSGKEGIETVLPAFLI